MSHYNFSKLQRYAIYTVHGESCYMCTKPIDLKTMEVDHILPESLLRDPDTLSKVLVEYGLAEDFNLNSCENWLPACRRCNGAKRETVFRPTPIIQLHVDKARKKAPQVIEMMQGVSLRKKVNNSLAVIELASEDGTLTTADVEALQPLVKYHFTNRSVEASGQPLRLTPLFEMKDMGDRFLVQGRFGVGWRPKGDHVDASFNCPTCGTMAGWNGARCVVCGMMDDD